MYKFRITNRSGSERTLQELTCLEGEYIGSPDNLKEGLTKSLEKKLRNYLVRNEKYKIDLELLDQYYYKQDDRHVLKLLLKGYRKYPNKGVRLTIELFEDKASRFSW